MDIRSLSPPPFPLTHEQARDWLIAFQQAFPRQGQAFEEWEADLARTAPVGFPTDLAAKLVSWLDSNALREPFGAGAVLSMRGVALILSSQHARLLPDRAWEESAELMAYIAWVNRAPAEQAPFRIADVLLFGSMTDPNALDHGDLDAILVLEPKRPGASSDAIRRLDDLGLGAILHTPESSIPSPRRALKHWLGIQQPFLSLDDTARTVETLLNEDPGFACHSLMGRDWTETALLHTTADEYASAIVQALANGAVCAERVSHIRARLCQAQTRLGMAPGRPDSWGPWAMFRAAERVADRPDHVTWWVGLNARPSDKDMGGLPPKFAKAWATAVGAAAAVPRPLSPRRSPGPSMG